MVSLFSDLFEVCIIFPSGQKFGRDAASKVLLVAQSSASSHMVAAMLSENVYDRYQLLVVM